MVLSRVGVFGGTFDPLHCGHLAVALLAKEEAKLDSVLFVPAGRPRLKSAEPIATPEQRLEMVRLAITGVAGFELYDAEVQREGPTLTADTLGELEARYGEGTELVFILGLDVLSRFDQWVQPERVVEHAKLLAVSRPGYSGFDWEDFYARNPYSRGRVECVESAVVDISASELRSRLATGGPVGGLLPESVERYIRESGLYIE